jgi:hypothetical protein
MKRTKEVKPGSRRTKVRSRRRDGRGLQGEGSWLVVSDVAPTQRSVSNHVAAAARSGSQMAPDSPHFSSLPCATPVRYYPRQEPNRLTAHAEICAGGAG